MTVLSILSLGMLASFLRVSFSLFMKQESNVTMSAPYVLQGPLEWWVGRLDLEALYCHPKLLTLLFPQ